MTAGAVNSGAAFYVYYWVRELGTWTNKVGLVTENARDEIKLRNIRGRYRSSTGTHGA